MMIKSGPRQWAPAEDALIRKLAAEKKTTRVMRIELMTELKSDRTRNAIIGRAGRLGIALLGTPMDGANTTKRLRIKEKKEKVAKEKKVAAPKPPKSPKPPAVVKAKPQAPVPVVRHTPQYVPKVPPVVIRDEDLIPIAKLTPTTCRYPVKEVSRNSWLFCGGKTNPEDAYCTEHASICYQPRKSK